MINQATDLPDAQDLTARRRCHSGVHVDRDAGIEAEIGVA